MVSYGCGTWSVTLREEHRLRVFENRVRSRIIGPKRGETTGGLKKLHNEKLHNLCSLANVIRMIKSEDEMGRACSTHGEKRNACRSLVG
jgi:hypothetical protein